MTSHCYVFQGLLFPIKSSAEVISEWCTSCCYPSWPGYYLLTIITFTSFNIFMYTWWAAALTLFSTWCCALCTYWTWWHWTV